MPHDYVEGSAAADVPRLSRAKPAAGVVTLEVWPHRHRHGLLRMMVGETAS